MNRVAVLIDGFNLYHSIRSSNAGRWLDLWGLSDTVVRSNLPAPTMLASVHYFSALAEFRERKKPGSVARHEAYIAALKASGVTVHLGTFKEKRDRCKQCGVEFTRHEEKESDVAIACRLLTLFATDQADTAIIVSGDTDMAPGIRAAVDVWPDRKVMVALPHNRHNAELMTVAHSTVRLRRHQYLSHQLPDPFTLPDGAVIQKPERW